MTLASQEPRKVSVQRTCSTCGSSTYSIQILCGDEDDEDGGGEQRYSALPAGWFYFPIDHKDGDDLGPLIMMHEFCSEACVMGSIALRAGAQPAPAPKVESPGLRKRHANESGPLTASLADLLKKKP